MLSPQQATLDVLQRAFEASAPRYVLNLSVLPTDEYELRVSIYPRARLTWRSGGLNDGEIIFDRDTRSESQVHLCRRYPLKPSSEQLIRDSLEMLEELEGTEGER